MAITAGDLISRTARILQDETNVRWLRTELLDWLNDAQREVVMYRPDASSVVGVMSLVAGTLQTLPSGGIKVLDVPRNMGSSGSTPGRSVRLVTREIMDAQNPNWHASTPATAIVHYMIDWRTPTRFYVYPPAAVPSSVEVVYSISPAPCTGEQSALAINEIYMNTLINYMLFRAYSKDAEYASNPQQAAAYYTLFSNEVGVKASADQTSAPNTLEQSNPNVRK
jgi:hypothetical protein